MQRQVLITGGNSGIGYEMAAACVDQGDHVIIASRDLAKSQAAAETIAQEAATTGQIGTIEALALDLGDLADVDRFAARLGQRLDRLDVAILNAGLFTNGTRALGNGLEAMIGIMHFGHFRLMQGLRELLVATPGARVVVTASVAHKLGRLRFETFDAPKKHWTAIQAYAQAKLANILFTRELAARLGEHDVVVNCFHPGAIATGIWTELPGPIRKLFGTVLTDTRTGADTGIWLACDDAARQHQGQYLVGRKPASISRSAADSDLARRLWRDTERRLEALTQTG